MVRLIRRNRAGLRDYTSRPAQWRLMLLILPLGLVIILMGKLRNPQTAQYINSLFDRNASRTSAPIAQTARPPLSQHATSAVTRPAVGARGHFQGIQADQLKAISDNTYFRKAEQQAWFHFFGALRESSPEQMQALPATRTEYVQLVDQPDFYRGHLVTVFGWVRQVTRQEPAENQLGIAHYFRVVIQPTDGVDWPIIAYCLELPPNLNVGDDLMGNVKITGLFFKNLSYRWENGLGVAPVIVALRPEYYGPQPGMPAGIELRQPAAADAWPSDNSAEAPAESHSAESTSNITTAFRDVLRLAGWDEERLAQFDNGQPFTEDDRRTALELLRRLRSCDSASLNDWVREGLSPHSMITQPGDYRGQLVRLSGHVTAVTRHAVAPADAERLELAEYFECEITPEGQGWQPMTVLTTRVPRAWLNAEKLDEPASATALYLKRIGASDPPSAVWLAKDIAWHPTRPNEPHVSYGTSLLGTLGMDVGLLDSIQSRGPIRAAERDAVYQLLHAAGQIGTHQLARAAQENLAAVLATWQRELAAARDEPHRQLAELVVRRAREGLYSVAPLFNEPERAIGELIVIDGTARRVVRIEVGPQPGGGAPSDAARRFQLDHYYEMEVFTDDSQNYPIVFCCRELPAGFPTTGELHRPVRAAGFFFKDWLYRSRQQSDGESGEQPAAGAANRAQYAPLVIGRGPIEFTLPASGGNIGQIVGGIVFLGALLAIWATAAWLARGDRRFHERRLAASFTLPPGQMLIGLNSEADGEPMK